MESADFILFFIGHGAGIAIKPLLATILFPVFDRAREMVRRARV